LCTVWIYQVEKKTKQQNKMNTQKEEILTAKEITRRNKTFAVICYLAFGCFVALMAYIFSGMAVYAS